MKLNLTTQFLLVSLTLSHALASTAGAIPPPTVASPAAVTPAKVAAPTTVPPAQSTSAVSSGVSFRCVQASSSYATVVSKGTKQAILITWNSTSFGSEYSPQVRCNTVTQKFQTMVNSNGGKLGNLLLTIGSIGNQTVVCVINQGNYGCNRENMLFTLNPENAKNPGPVLASILQVGKYGSGNVVIETDELPEFSLEEVVNQNLSNAPQVASPEQPSLSDQPSITPAEAPAISGDNGGSAF